MINSQYKVRLNGVDLVNEPIGLIDTELTITRDELLKGVLFSYTTDLTFFGDGYSILAGIRANGCASVDCVIFFDCENDGGYQVLFEGVIPVGSDDVEWDDYNCTVTTKVENADFSNFLQTYGDFRFIINSEFCIDGTTALAPITGFDVTMFRDFDNAGLTSVVKSYKFIDAFRQTLAYLTNNAVDLDEDPIYAVDYLPQIYEVAFNTAYGALTTFQLNWVNFYDQQMQQDKVGLASEVAFFRSLEHDIALQPDLITARTIRTNYMATANTTAVSGGGNRLIINYVPWQSLLSASTGGVSPTITETQAFQYGLNNLKITTDTAMVGQTNDISISLNDLMTHSSQMHNMGFYMQRTGNGTYDLVLRYYPDLINNATTGVNTMQVKALTSKSSGDFAAKTLTTAKGQVDNIHKEFTWITDTCYGASAKIEASGISTQEIFQAFTLDTPEDKLFFYFTSVGDDNIAAKFTPSSMYNDGASFFLQARIQLYNAPYWMPLLASRNVMYAGGLNYRGQLPLVVDTSNVTCSNCPDATILNDSGVLFKEVAMFEHQLSFAQVQLLISQSLQFINFSTDRGINKAGFIKEVKIPFKTFIANFEVYTS